jgi:hypothetical protein
MIKAITATKSTCLGSWPWFSMWRRIGLHSSYWPRGTVLLIRARSGSSSNAQSSAALSRLTPGGPSAPASSKSRAIAFFGRVYRLSANLFHQQVRMFLFGKSPVWTGGFMTPFKTYGI